MKLKALTAIAIAMSICIAGCTISEGNPDDLDSALAAPIEDDDGSAGSLFEPAAGDETGVTNDGDTYGDDDRDGGKDKDVDNDARLDPLAISGDKEIEVGTLAEFEQIYSARGGNDEEYYWVISGAPEWIEHEMQGSRRIVLRGTTPFLMADQSFTLELTAIDALDERLEVTEVVKIKVLGANIEPIQATPYRDRCAEPLKIEISAMGNYVDPDVLNGGKFEFGIASAIKLGMRVKRGDGAPLGDVTWSWDSKVDDSYYCKKNNRKGVAGALDEFDDIKYIGKAYPIGRDSYYPITLDGDDYTFGEECVDDDEGQWTRNYSWRLGNEGPADGSAERRVESKGDSLILFGEFIFPQQPMPVLKFYDDGVEDMSRNPVERLVITASDKCGADDSARIELEFELSYPNERISDVNVKIDYKNAQSYDKETHVWKEGLCSDGGHGWCEEFRYSNISLFLHYEKPKGDKNLITDIYDESIAFAAYRLQDLEERGDGEYSRKLNTKDDTHGVENAKHLTLRVDGVGKIKEKWVCPIWFCFKMDEHKYDDIDIKSIELETLYWETEYYDSDDSDEWTWEKDKLHDYVTLHRLSDDSEMDAKNSDGGIFHRKTWMPLNFSAGSFEAELITD